MKGIYFINEKWQMNDYTTINESTDIQKESILSYLEANHIESMKLNPYQMNDYYTIPHALFYDLKQIKPQLDCLVLYSAKAIDTFIASYPARWLVLKSFFNEVIFVDEAQTEQWQDIS
ncbi:hypothetical protein [Cytobacillus purgationiresistens]|uniref:Uncharacterized protein n=1 Tax=Cytobacillus purgationiresistens TaxID=863449 RepID=A0ABU0ALY7_9BACI|nr:hypothetical protein [Cytobacillus purgationiresistens]MDQ0272252.1 hypothetical protein [Cytobacillus purgationiresistens]